MEEWIPVRAFVVPRWFRSRKIYKRALLAGALTTAVIIITWKFQSRKSKSKFSSKDVETSEDETQQDLKRLQTSCIDSSTSITACDIVDECQLETITQKEEPVLYSGNSSTISSKQNVELLEREYLPDLTRETFSKKYHENERHHKKFDSMLSSLQGDEPKGRGGSNLLAAASSASSSVETDSDLGFPSFFSKADTSSTCTTPISKHPNSNSGVITESNWFVDKLPGQSLHKLCCQPASLSMSHMYGENSEGFDISTCATQSKIRKNSQELQNTPIPPAKFWCRGNIADTADDTNMEDHCHSITNELHTNSCFVPSNEMTCFGLLNGELYGLLDSNENQSRNIESVGANQGYYHAKLCTYNDYLMDPKLSAHMKLQVQRAKASLQTFYEIGEP